MTQHDQSRTYYVRNNRELRVLLHVEIVCLSRVMVKLADRRRRENVNCDDNPPKAIFLMYIQYINLERYTPKQIMQLPNGIRLY